MKESIVFGTVVLIITNFFVKILSLLYRGVLIRLVGSEGLGLSEMIMPIFSFLLVVSSLGIPLAMSNLISYDIKKTQRISIVKTGLIFLLFNSLVVTVIAFLFFPYVVEYILPDNRLILSFLLLFPAVVIISVFSAYRGYFQGSQQSSFIGKSQVLEQITRVLIGIAIVSFLLKQNYTLSIIIGGLSVATIFAECFGGIYLWNVYRKQKKKEAKGYYSKDILKNLVKMGSPLTLSRLITSIAISAQAILIPKALMASGYSISMSASLFGYFSGVALTVLHLPNIITNSITIPLIPSIAEAYKKKDTLLLKTRIHDSIMFTTYTAIPLLAFIFYYATPLCSILFAAKEAGPMLALLCLGGIFLYLQQPIVGILQGLNAFKEILLCLCIGDGAYILMLVYCYLSGNFTIEQGIYAFILNDIILLMIYVFLLKHKTKIRLQLGKLLFYPTLCSFLTLFALYLIKKYLITATSSIVEITILGIFFTIVYLLFMYLFGAIEKEMIHRLLFRKGFRKNRASS